MFHRSNSDQDSYKMISLKKVKNQNSGPVLSFRAWHPTNIWLCFVNQPPGTQFASIVNCRLFDLSSFCWILRKWNRFIDVVWMFRHNTLMYKLAKVCNWFNESVFGTIRDNADGVCRDSKKWSFFSKVKVFVKRWLRLCYRLPTVNFTFVAIDSSFLPAVC